ncbi:MAG: toll/interleukin-1 receptor domain-containing protein [Anaerolineae bacterium]|nr:toll/interleukin-1 receptor domain-containing protein [Anaerolineae bacterium]
MLDIAFGPAQADLAQQLQQALAASRSLTNLDKATLLVLATPQSLQDADVQQAIAKAKKSDKNIIPLLLEPTQLPDDIALHALDLTGQDLTEKNTVKRIVNHTLRAQITQQKRRTNWLLMGLIGLAAFIVFFWAITSLSDGTIAFPVEVYATENAARETMIATLVHPTLEGLQPRTTEDAANFPATVEAASTRDRAFLRGTATQLPLNQQATQAIIIATQTAAAEQSAVPTFEPTAAPSATP